MIGVKIYLTKAITVPTPGLTLADPVPPEPSEMGHGLSGDVRCREHKVIGTVLAVTPVPLIHLCQPCVTPCEHRDGGAHHVQEEKLSKQKSRVKLSDLKGGEEILSCVLFKHTYTQSHIYTYRKFRL